MYIPRYPNGNVNTSAFMCNIGWAFLKAGFQGFAEKRAAEIRGLGECLGRFFSNMTTKAGACTCARISLAFLTLGISELVIWAVTAYKARHGNGAQDHARQHLNP